MALSLSPLPKRHKLPISSNMDYADATTMLACREELDAFIAYLRDNLLQHLCTQYTNAYDHGARPFRGASENMSHLQHDLMIYGHQITAVQRLLLACLNLRQAMESNDKAFAVDYSLRDIRSGSSLLAVWFRDVPELRRLQSEIKVLATTIKAGSQHIPACPDELLR